MVIEEMMAYEEQILWEGGKSEESTFWESIFNPLLPFALLWCVVDFSVIGTAGISGMLFSGMGFFFLFHLMPVWLYIGGIVTSKSRAKNTRYAVTTRGIYIQTGKPGREQVKFYRYDEIKYSQTKQGHFDRQYDVGDVACEYVTPIVKYTGRNRRVETHFTIENIAEYQTVSQIINEQKRMQQPVGPQIPLDNNPLTARRIPQALQQLPQIPPQPVYQPQQVRPAEPPKPQPVIDPQQAFFGSAKEQPLPGEQRSVFLDPKSAEQKEFLDNLPDESVSALQHELFDGEDVRTQAFPDPSVNPLPVLPGEAPQPYGYAQPQQAVNPYAGMQMPVDPYARPRAAVDPYAMPQEQGSVWGAQKEPEMEPLFTEPPLEDPTLRALEELKPLEEHDTFQQGGM